MNPGGIRTRNPSKQAAADLRLRPRGHRNGLYISHIIDANLPISSHMDYKYINIYIYTYRVLVGKPERKRPLGRPRRRWDVNIKMDLLGVGCGGMDWIELAQDRDSWPALVNAVKNLLVSYNARNSLTRWQPVSFSRRTVLHGVIN